MTVAAILAGKGHEVVTVTADHSVAEALAVLADRRIGAVPVMADDGVAGVFSERDVILCLAREGASALDRSVGEVMTAPAVTVRSEEHTSELQSLTRNSYAVFCLKKKKKQKSKIAITTPL